MPNEKQLQHRYKCNNCYEEQKVEDMFFIDLPVGRMWCCIDPFKRCAEIVAKMVTDAAQSAREAFRIQDEVKRLALKGKHDGR